MAMSHQTSYQKIGTYILCGVVGAFMALGIINVIGTAHAEQGRSLGPYMMMQHSNPTATAGIFRINVNTGYVSYCYIDSGAKPNVACTAETP
jgi:hypothetical protein